MSSMKEKYEEYYNERLANIDKELISAGLRPFGVNRLAHMMSGIPLPLSFEEFAESFAGVLYEGFRANVANGVAQSQRARKPRVKVGDDGETIRDIIGTLALANEYREESARKLWNRFYGELDSLALNPKETTHESGDFNKLAYEYDFNSSRRKITFGRFAVIVSAVRTEKKLC